MLCHGCMSVRSNRLFHGTLSLITRGARARCRRNRAILAGRGDVVHPAWRPTVAGYTITIAPTDNEAGPQTTVRVDTSSGSPRITELTVRATGGGGLGPHQLPPVNLDAPITAP